MNEYEQCVCVCPLEAPFVRRTMPRPDALRRICKHEKIMALITRIMEILRKYSPVIFLRAFFVRYVFVGESTDHTRFSRPWFVPFYRSFDITMSVGSCVYASAAKSYFVNPFVSVYP